MGMISAFFLVGLVGSLILNGGIVIRIYYPNII
jgi:hypothetical protein